MNTPSKKERIVVKIGTALLTREDGTLNTEYIDTIAGQIAVLQKDGRYEIAVVTSGAVAAGVGRTGKERNDTIERDQALASFGQGPLMHAWEEAFKKHGLHAGQILLTARDLECKTTIQNTRAAVEEVWSMGGIPVVNENDTTATEELRQMSNDPLAARFGNFLKASELYLLTGQDGIFDKNPDDHNDAQLLEVLTAGQYEGIETEGKSDTGTGGAGTKLKAGKIFHGTVHVANGTADLAGVISGDIPHTRIIQNNRNGN